MNTVFLQTQTKLCIVHMARNPMKYVSWKDYKLVTGEFKMNIPISDRRSGVIRKVIKKRKLFPSDDSLKKVVYLAIDVAFK